MIDTGPNGPKGPHRFVSFKMTSISGVDRPAQGPATACVVAKRATDPQPATPRETAMDYEKLYAAIKKRLEAMQALSGAQHDHFRTLGDADQESFLGMTDGARNVVVAKALEANPIVATLDDGTIIRHSDGPVAVSLAKQLVKTKQSAEVASLAASATVYKARAASELSNLPLSPAAGVELLIAVDKISNDALRAEVAAAIAAKNTGMGKAGQVLGVIGGRVTKNAAPAGDVPAGGAFMVAVHKYAKENKVDLRTAYGEVLATTEGAALKDEHDAEQGVRGPDGSP